MAGAKFFDRARHRCWRRHGRRSGNFVCRPLAQDLHVVTTASAQMIQLPEDRSGRRAVGLLRFPGVTGRLPARFFIRDVLENRFERFPAMLKIVIKLMQQYFDRVHSLFTQKTNIRTLLPSGCCCVDIMLNYFATNSSKTARVRCITRSGSCEGLSSSEQ